MRTLPRVVLAVSALLVACPKRVVTVNGQEMSEEAASVEAQRELAQFRVEAASQPPEVAAERFEAIAARFGDAPASAEALYEAGVRWRQARRPDRARAALSRLLTRFPLSPRSTTSSRPWSASTRRARRPARRRRRTPGRRRRGGGPRRRARARARRGP